MAPESLLTITARGSAIIAELNRLHELVPGVFLETAQTEPQYLDREKKFTINDLISDFGYFTIQELFEAKIDSNDALKRADGEFCNDYIDILTRFYLTFESVQRYASDLNAFVQEVDDDLLVGQSFDSLLADVENRQLLCESYFLLGHMLLTIDNYFESSLREKIIISYYRYSSYKSSPSSNLDETCNLMRSTGFIGGVSQLKSRSTRSSACESYRPENYPECFFSRAGVNSSLVSLLVSKLLSVDIYNQTVVAFPHPDHRSTALSTQASMLYVILYFCPNILDSQRSKMREITDKFFYDNWVTSIYMGDLVNLIEAWNPYTAARESLVQLLELESTRTLAEQYKSRFERAFRQMKDYLKEGWLDESRVLEHHARILTLIRESNVILRWFMLHSHTRFDWNLKLSKLVFNLVTELKPSDEDLYVFLQNLAEIERKFLVLYEELLKRRDGMIIECRTRAIETLSELIEIFNDLKPMRYIQAGSNTKLAQHLSDILDNLKANSKDEFGRDLIISVINRVGQLQDQYSDGKNLQVVQLFSEIKDSLLQALRLLSLSHDIRIILQSIGDFSYAWRILPEKFTPHMQQIIKENPLRVNGIGATFLKLASAFDASLVRIQQVDSQLDLVSVSKYYSWKLMSNIRDVLHVIPATILELLGLIIEIQTECVMGDLPSRISLDKLRDYALPEKRLQMLELTYKVSHYAESLMLMQNIVIGLIQVDSRRMLEDGIRGELVRRMSDSIRVTLSLNSADSKASGCVQLASALTKRLERLVELMGGFKRSLEYVQDYLFIYGLKMWQEELGRIVRFNVSMATSALQGKSYLQQSVDSQSSSAGPGRIPVPVYDPNPLKSSFIVLLLDELLQITDPRATIYDEQMSAWYEQRDHERVLDLRVFELIGSSLGVVGLNGLDELCSCLLMIELQRLDERLVSLCCGQSSHPAAGSDLQESLERMASSRDDAHKRIYARALKAVAPHSEQLVNHLSSIGQLQLIRTSIGCVLSTRSRCEARTLYACLSTLNGSLLEALRRGGSSSSSQQKVSSASRGPGKVSDANQEAALSMSRAHEASPGLAAPADDDADCAELVAAAAAAAEAESVDLGESQLIFELANHLEWVGLSDPLSKIYTLSLQSSRSSQVHDFRQRLLAVDLMFVLLLEHCSGKFLFSKSISGFLPKPTRSGFYVVDAISQHSPPAPTDAGPLLCGLVTLLNHCQPQLVCAPNSSLPAPCERLLNQMAAYVRRSFKPHDLGLDSVNMLLSMIELVRLAGLPLAETLSRTCLPQYVFDTFQFAICQLDGQAQRAQ